MKQVRFVPIEACNLQVREPQEGEQESRTIVGMPIVYGVRSRNLTPWSEDREVYEVLEAGFISPELLQRSDVVLNLNHSNKVPTFWDATATQNVTPSFSTCWRKVWPAVATCRIPTTPTTPWN